MHLPEEVWRRVYEFDPTFKRDVWQKVTESLPLFRDFQYEWKVKSEPYPLVIRWHCLANDRSIGCWVYESAPWLTGMLASFRLEQPVS